MEHYQEWLPVLLAILIAVAKVLNSKTEHWTKAKTKAGKVVAFLIEVLDIVRIPEVTTKANIKRQVKEIRKIKDGSL